MLTRSFIILCIAWATKAWPQVLIETYPLEITPQGEDYAPVILDSGFVMVSVREPRGPIDHRDAETGKHLSDLYWVPWRDRAAGTPVLFSANLATPVNEGPASFANGGRTICFTRNLTIPRKLSNMRGAPGQLGLFFSELVDGVWITPVPFPYNSSKYAIVHPAFDAAGTTLYFASDMPGGHGGMDIYSSLLTAEGWSRPENLGALVNGPGNEVFPVLLADGMLHFSSDRQGGLGGLDIYRIQWNGAGWNIPEHLPDPINSSSNEHGLVHFPGGLDGLFSSDRDGRDRIYRMKRTTEKFRACTGQRKNNHCYAFRARPHSAMMNLPLDHVWDLGDGTTSKGLVAKHCYDDPGTYTVRSMLVDRTTGQLFHVLRTNELPSLDHVQAFIHAPDTVRTGTLFMLDPSHSHVPGLTVAEYHWDLGDGTHLEGERIQHRFRQAGTYEVRLDLRGTLDRDGQPMGHCNMRRIVVMDRHRESGQEGMAAVYQDASGMMGHDYIELPYDEHYVSEDGIGDARYSVELFASKERMDLNDPRFLSVREHHRVVERFDPKRGVYTYSVGETNDLEELYQVFRMMKELDFLDAEVFLLDIEKLIDMSELDMAQLEDLNNGTVRSHAIRFAFNSAELEDGSLEALWKMKELLDQHPKLRLVVEAHTDDIGSTHYNLELSEKRAATVSRQLTIMGIDPERLVAMGHGKNHPLANNSSEEGRSMNRRVEFRMTMDHVEQAFEKTR